MALSSKTLFFRNLPYSATDAQLEQVCSRYGAVKACFTVKERGTSDCCRGFGYVTYHTREDAEKAKSLIKVIGGRPVQIVFAKQREPRKKGGKVKVDKEGDGCKESDAIHREEEEEEGVKRETSSDSEDDYETLSAKAGGHPRKHKQKAERGHAKFDIGRVVVVGHLPAGTAVGRLREECETIGKVENLEFPVSDREIPSAFISFSTHKEARLAVVHFNGRSFDGALLSAQLLSREGKRPSNKSLKKSRLIIRNLSFKCSEADVRRVFEKHGHVVEVHIPRKPNGHMLGYAFVQYASYFDAKTALELVNMTEVKGRPVAVDWVVPKDQYEQSAKSEHEGEREEHEGEREEEDTERLAELSETDLDDAGGSLESDLESHDTSHDISHDNTMDPSEEDAKTREDVGEGKTLFIRNLPLHVDHKELKQLFYRFGRVRYCRVMLSPDTGLCTGSAFLQFKESSSLKSCLAASASTGDQGLIYCGHHLDVSMALSRGEVEKVCKEREEGRGKRGEDKRNLYLTKEGVILPGSEAAAELSKTDMARRMKIYSQKRSKLANPHFFVSRTRLSVHNIPVSVDECRLKKVFLQAAGDKDARIGQVKILRSSERVNSKGVGRSLGFGFVEYTTHEAALAALRATNNNPRTFGEKRRLIVEFAVEDSRAIKLRERRRQRQISQVKVKSSSSACEPTDIQSSPVERGRTLTKRQKWMLKCRAKRLRRKERKKYAVSGSGPTNAHKEDGGRSENKLTVTEHHSPSHNDRSLAASRAKKPAEVGMNTCGRHSRKRKIKGVESCEEEAFARMVDKYRKKLEQSES